MSLDPLILDLSLARSLTEFHCSMEAVKYSKVSADDNDSVSRKIDRNLAMHLFASAAYRQVVQKRDRNHSDLRIILEKINECYEHELKLRGSQKSKILIEIQTKSIQFLHIIVNPLLFPVTILWFMIQFLAELGLYILNSRIKLFNKAEAVKIAAKDVSTVAYQMNLRLQQICFWPGQYMAWRKSAQKLSALPQAQYIGFYNTVWLIANDVIVGRALGSFIMLNADILASQLAATSRPKTKRRAELIPRATVFMVPDALERCNYPADAYKFANDFMDYWMVGHVRSKLCLVAPI
ncbi:phosphatidylinositol N-acetylglucosaminyltransferase subunit gpi1 [Physocladia obscura]|uniref:Phosphatidylinositol N-acetylglucosaminyltransferase subunit gpi1 n=1 Tax=Physocladia obscura TaxID=109957 RepID=A0AAD5XJU2_9FUNG|nr:phosphatidylinositol N-acetylglucosaminyltransferase subunit gpi1 [Physocladia obscura]